MSATLPASDEAEAACPDISVLDDGPLAAVLLRVLPCPGLVATASALSARRAHLTCQIDGTRMDLTKPDEVRAWTATWQDYLQGVPIPEQVARLPLWCRSHDAEAVYDDLAAQRQVTLQLVCKRWQRVAAAFCCCCCFVSAKAVLGTVATRPPLTTETLIAVYDWNKEAQEANADSIPAQLEDLTALPALRTYIAWNTFLPGSEPEQDRYAHYYNNDMTIKAPPPLPQSLTTLQHLLYFQPQQAGRLDRNESEAFAVSVARLTNLRTLVLPRGLTLTRPGGHLLLHRLTKLESLAAPNVTKVGLEHAVPRLPALRRLTASAPKAPLPPGLFGQPFDEGFQVEVFDEGVQDVGMQAQLIEGVPQDEAAADALLPLQNLVQAQQADEEAADVLDGAIPVEGDADKAPSQAEFGALESVTLERAPWARLRFNGIESTHPASVMDLCVTQPNLERLVLDAVDYGYTQATMAQIAARARSLKHFELREVDVLEQPVPFEAFAGLVELYITRNAKLSNESLNNLASLVKLKCLTMRVQHAGALSAPLGCLRALTRLTLHASPLDQADCEAIACLRLERLCLELCTFDEDASGALSALRCLESLREFVLRSCKGVLTEALSELHPGNAFPRLALFEVHARSHEQPDLPDLHIPAELAAELSQLYDLHDIILSWCELSDDTLRELGHCLALRRLDIRYTRGWSTAALPSLLCPKLLVVDARGTPREAAAEDGADEPVAPMPQLPYTLLTSYRLN